MRTRSLPAALLLLALAAAGRPAPCQSPCFCNATMGAKSTERSRMSAECSPPSRSRTSVLISR